ncbi:disease resistance protein RPV1-like isoform X3 [Prosopis cineraria]|uniref:disease resistance protein RPV1-like isoform X3 n=1 Tax=Prosopis cineraria TaxID=364024 RepID=UPI00240EE453|nr:disease resistance protein RPV1-like isoform X3 [Prosopis cineraria]
MEKIRLVKCPKCKKILPEPRGYIAYQCGGCGAVLKARVRGKKHDVFLSYRGEDTRASFTSHLYSSLCNAGINVFKDDVEIPRGNHISIELSQGIESSEISIIILSKRYAGSRWCLEELSKIMELHKRVGLVVLPVFYDVDPSDVRRLTSSFGEAFEDLILRISPAEYEVFRWRIALREVGGIAGFVVFDSRNESEDIENIVEHVCNILDKKDLFVTDHPVGVDSRVQDVISMLQKHQSKDVVLDRNDVTQILNGCGVFADIGISVLKERSLVTIDRSNKLGMHDLLRDMGREIIREQSPKEPGERSRLWFHGDVQAVLSKCTGTNAIEGLALKLTQTEKMHFQTKAFKKMNRLRLLHLDNVLLRGDYEYIGRDLRWLCWHSFPLKYVPSNFYQENLVAVDLKYSSLTRMWKEPQLLERLKILNLSHCTCLEQTPDFSKLPSLEKLILKDCPSLSMIHHSIGLLDELVLLNLKDCTGLRSLPGSIYKLKSLKTLILSGCLMIEKLEEDIEQMDSLTTLIADNTAITQVPSSLIRLKRIGYISLCGYEGLTQDVFPSLIWSRMSPTNSALSLIPTYGGMPSPILWDMLNSSIPGASSIPSNLPQQQSLLLEYGLDIQTQVNRGITKMMSSLFATNCNEDISRLDNCLRYLLIKIGMTDQDITTLSECITQGLTLAKCSDDCILPGDNYPYWLTFKGKGASVKFKVPRVSGPNFKGIALCYVYFPAGDSGNMSPESSVNLLLIVNYTKKTTLLYERDRVTSFGEAKWKEIITNLSSDDEVEVIAVLGMDSL